MSNKLDLINKLRDIRDEISDIDMDITANDKEQAFDMCDVAEHMELVLHHLHVAINKLIIIHCFEKKEEKGNEKTD